MAGQKGRQRSGSVVQEENRKKEAQLWHEEGNCHIKAGNLQKALSSYTKVFINVTSCFIRF